MDGDRYGSQEVQYAPNFPGKGDVHNRDCAKDYYPFVSGRFFSPLPIGKKSTGQKHDNSQKT